MTGHDNDDEESEQEIARLVRVAREAKGWTQHHVADLMQEHGFSWTQSTVSRVESGRQGLRLREARVLARVLGIDKGPGWLRWREDEP